MKTLAQVQQLVDLDSRVINAAAILEYELRDEMNESPEKESLGEMVQQYKSFQTQGFIRDVNFAIGVRNSIAHLNDGVESSDKQKARAAEYLIKAVRLARQQTDDAITPDNSIGVDGFDTRSTRLALRALLRRRIGLAGIAALILVAAVTVAAQFVLTTVPLQLIVLVTMSLGCFQFAATGFNRSIRHNDYYTLPGSQFERGDHRCIHCGHRGRDGRGIYTHGKYRSSTKYHECSKCKHLLFIS